MKKQLLAIGVILTLLTGCSSIERDRGVSLSSAIKGNDNNSHSEENNEYHRHEHGRDRGSGDIILNLMLPWRGNGSVEISNDERYDYNERREEKRGIPGEEGVGKVVIGHGRSFYSGNDISEIENLTFSLKAGDENVEVGIGVLAGSYRLKNNFKYKSEIEPGIVLGIEGKAKGYIKKLSENLKIGAGGGFSVNYLDWSYTQPLQYDYEIVTDDNITFVKIFGLMGIDYTKRESLYLNFEVTPEVILTSEDTRGGFRNDVFKNHVGLGYRFEIGKTF